MKIVREAPSRTAHYKVFKDESYRFRWAYIAASGHCMAESSMSYASLDAALNALENFTASLAANEMIVWDSIVKGVSTYQKHQEAFRASGRPRQKGA